MLLLYGLYLFFQLSSHAYIFEDDEAHPEVLAAEGRAARPASSRSCWPRRTPIGYRPSTGPIPSSRTTTMMNSCWRRTWLWRG